MLLSALYYQFLCIYPFAGLESLSQHFFPVSFLINARNFAWQGVAVQFVLQPVSPALAALFEVCQLLSVALIDLWALE